MAWYHVIGEIRRVHVTNGNDEPVVNIRGANPAGEEPQNVALEFESEEHLAEFIEALESDEEDTIERWDL